MVRGAEVEAAVGLAQERQFHPLGVGLGPRARIGRVNGRERRRARETRGGAPVGEVGVHERRAEGAGDGREVGTEARAPVAETRRVRVGARRKHEVRTGGTHAAVGFGVVVAAAEEALEEVVRAPESRAPRAKTQERSGAREGRICGRVIAHYCHAVGERGHHEALVRKAARVDSQLLRERARSHEDHGARRVFPALAHVGHRRVLPGAEVELAPERAHGLAHGTMLGGERRRGLDAGIPHYREDRPATFHELHCGVSRRGQLAHRVQRRIRHARVKRACEGGRRNGEKSCGGPDQISTSCSNCTGAPRPGCDASSGGSSCTSSAVAASASAVAASSLVTSRFFSHPGVFPS